MMGVRLIVEVLDHWKDFGLTAGERGDLIVIAENANDATRKTYGPLHEPYILARVDKTPEGWKNALGKLMRKKALTFATAEDGRELRGHSGQHAVYEVAELCPDPPHDGHLGMCTRPEEQGGRVTPQVTQKGHPSGDPTPEKGHPAGGEGSPERRERVTQQVTPTPPTPQNPSSSPRARAEQLMRQLGATEDETRKILDKIEASGNIRNLAAYLKQMERQGDLSRMIAEERQATGQRQATARQSITMAGGHHAYQDDGCSTGTCVCERPRRHGVHGGT